MATNDESKNKGNNETLNDALDRSFRELQILANVYHQHGYSERAQELYSVFQKLNKERKDQTSRSDDAEKSA